MTAPPPSSSSPLAVVTGASSGIGLHLARLLAARGQPVLAVARRAERLDALAAEARAGGGAPIHPLALDLGSAGAAGRVRDAARALGGAGWLVNNAGFGMYGRFADARPERLAEMVRLNCEVLVVLTRVLLDDVRSARGAILNVASAAAFQPTPFMSVYGATKAFVLSFTEGLAEELRGTGVVAAAFCPGPVATEFGEVAGTGQRFRQVPGTLTAEAAARAAIAQVDRREVVFVPGSWSKLSAQGGRFVPRAVLRRMSAAVLKPTEGA